MVLHITHDSFVLVRVLFLIFVIFIGYSIGFLFVFVFFSLVLLFFFFQAEDGIRDLVRSRGLGDVYKRQIHSI